MILIFDILLQDCYWSICHVSWVIRFESGLRNIDFSQRYQVEKLAQYRWDIRYFELLLVHKLNKQLVVKVKVPKYGSRFPSTDPGSY